jgi:hypothetical protein
MPIKGKRAAGEWSAEMSFLDWVKRRGSESPENVQSAAPQPSKSPDGLFAEMRQDYQLARQRDETGREPESVAPEMASAPKAEMKKQPPRRERMKGHDIPF